MKHSLGRQPTNASVAPSYKTIEKQAPDYHDGIELSPLSGKTPSYSSGEGHEDDDGRPPPYAMAASGASTSAHAAAVGLPNFTPHVQLHIQTAGKAWLSGPATLPLEPIPVCDVVPDGGASEMGPRYVSIRHVRRSGTACLVSGAEGGSSSGEGGGGDFYGDARALSDTTYRYGLGKPPLVRMWLPGQGPSAASLAEVVKAALQKKKHRKQQEEELQLQQQQQQQQGECGPLVGDGQGDDGVGCWDSFEIESVGLLTRAQRFKTRLGTFQWRYGGKKEREAAGHEVNSLLVLDRVVRVFYSSNNSNSYGNGNGNDNYNNVDIDVGSSGINSGGVWKGKRRAAAIGEQELRTPVAMFVRNAEFRTPGSGPTTAGNGGRLMVDFSGFSGVDGEVEGFGAGQLEKDEREMLLVLAVTTCVCMLKKEVDRRRGQQIAILALAAAASGTG